MAAAASLKNAYEEELIPMFEEKNPGVTVSGTYDSSGKLQTQIEEGSRPRSRRDWRLMYLCRLQ